MAVPTTMRVMRIARHGGPDVLTKAEVPVPSLAAGEVLVRVSAVALNNTDLWTREGAYGRPGDPTALSGWRGPIEFPRIQGADVAAGSCRWAPAWTPASSAAGWSSIRRSTTPTGRTRTRSA